MAEDPEQEEGFDQFQALTQKLLKVPKQEVDALRAKEIEKKNDNSDVKHD